MVGITRAEPLCSARLVGAQHGRGDSARRINLSGSHQAFTRTKEVVIDQPRAVGGPVVVIGPVQVQPNAFRMVGVVRGLWLMPVICVAGS